MNTRLRNQEVTVKPRIVVNGDSFKVEYFGRITKQQISVGHPTHESALAHANMLARFNKFEIEPINKQREKERMARILASMYAAAGFGVPA
uniref:hypothetical protein n=1 Tax=Arthrobacter silvisoli TaxID=2291022 RepID=UPI003F494B10